MEEYKRKELRVRIGRGLMSAREARKETQRHVEQSSHIIRSNRLSQIELGKASISTEEFVELCAHYKTTPDIVLGTKSKLPSTVYHQKISKLLDEMSEREVETVYRLLETYSRNK